ncbi:hypothetical protein [Streptomyces sp. NPDC001852]|uniref:hypothetical protein n=1 Tax=Streptomyces sp. NPDC001852 TaxID=3364619 RepID=UPI0036AE9AF2
MTADTLHTVADHARYLHRRGAFGLFPVKENRAALFAQLDALNWDETTNPQISMVRTEETNSGRHETRIVRVQALEDGQVNFPHATQALLVERYTTGRGDQKVHADAELGITPHLSRPPTRPPSPAACEANGPSNPSISSET